MAVSSQYNHTVSHIIHQPFKAFPLKRCAGRPTVYVNIMHSKFSSVFNAVILFGNILADNFNLVLYGFRFSVIVIYG